VHLFLDFTITLIFFRPCAILRQNLTKGDESNEHESTGH